MAAGHFALVGMGIVVDEALVASATVSAAPTGPVFLRRHICSVVT